MWTWLVAGGAGVGALAGAILLRRARRRPNVGSQIEVFLDTVRESIERRGARLAGVVPGRFTAIIEIDRQETPVPLQPLLRHWQSFPTDVDVVVGRIIAEIRAEGLDCPNDFLFAEHATDLLPQVRSLDWIAANSPRFGDGRLVHRAIGPDLGVCYVIDDSWSMVFVCEAHLRQWGKTEADLFGLARRNLAVRTTDDVQAQLARGAPVTLRSGDGYAAARFLLLDIERSEDLLIALPDRDVLWIGSAANADLADLMSRSADECAHSSRPVSPKLYHVSAGELTAVEI